MATYEIETINDLKHAAKQAGSHFFSRDTMRFFSSKVHSVYGVPGGAVFVTSEKPPYSGRVFTVRFWDSSTGSARSMRSDIPFKDDAQDEARKIARKLRSGHYDPERIFENDY